MPYIIDVLSEGEGGGFSLDGSFVRESFTIVYLVCGDTPEDTHDYILVNTPGLPIVGEYFGAARCQARTADPVDSTAMLWHVLCDFDSKQDQRFGMAQTQEDLNKPPQFRRPVYTWTSELSDVDMTHDACNGEALTNPVGQPYEIVTQKPIANLVIERYELPVGGYFDPTIIWQYVGYINADTFWGFPALTVLCTGISSTEETQQDTTDPLNPVSRVYQKVSYNFRIRSNVSPAPPHGGGLGEIGWNIDIPIIGTQEFRDVGSPATLTLVRSMDRYVTAAGSTFGHPAEGAQPIEVMLNTDGTRAPDQSNPFWRYICRYPNRPFAPLNLGPQAAYTSQAFLDKIAAFAEQARIPWVSPLQGGPPPPPVP